MKRQGDLVIKSVKELPKRLKEVKGGIILRGEATGHAHRLVGGDVFSGKDGLIYLMLAKAGSIVHDEHKPLNLKAGKYMVIRQREYQSKDMARLVQD